MKKISYLMLLLFLPTFIMAQWVTDKQYGFKIEVPSNWSKESAMEGTDKTHSFSDPTQNVFIQVRAFKAQGITADKISQVFESQYLPSANRVAFEAYTLNNTPGKFAGYTMHVDGLDVGIGAFYAVKNGIGYVIWSMIETKHYNEYSGQGDAVMNTFTTFSSSARAVVIPSSFKITNMKLGTQMTANYDILAQNETTIFDSDQEKIYVIWDWEGSAAGKTKTIKWYKGDKEIEVARQSFALGNEKQGYGYASIDRPNSGFQEGNYHVQIDFENKKQRSINFTIKKAKAASNQNAGFVIKPPSTKGKGLQPQNQSSSFVLDVQHVQIGTKLKPGSKTILIDPSTVFQVDTKEIIVVFNWDGNGNEKQLKINWDFYQPGSSNKIHIASDTYYFPNTNGGGSNFALTKPNKGWPVGQYWVEFSIDDQFEYEWKFEVKGGSAPTSSGNSSSSKTNWGKASGGSAAASSSSSKSSSSSSVSAKTIVLISAKQSCYSFKTAKVHNDHNTADIMVEPWCTEEAGVCGNWVATQQTSWDAVTSPPASGYISDVAGYTDCQIMPTGKVVVVKLNDGTYAKILIVKTEFSKIQNSDRPCQHKTTIKVQYPF